MAKTALLINPLGLVDQYTEGVNNVYKIYVKYSGFDIINVQINYNDGSKRNYYKIPAIIGDNIIPPAPAPSPTLFCKYIKLTTAQILANTNYDILPAPGIGTGYVPYGFAFIYNYIAPAFTNTGVGNWKLRANGSTPSNNIINYNQITPAQIYINTQYFAYSPSYFPGVVPYTTKVDILNTMINSNGAGNCDLFFFYSIAILP
jgi:hypothetical protein